MEIPMPRCRRSFSTLVFILPGVVGYIRIMNGTIRKGDLWLLHERW